MRIQELIDALWSYDPDLKVVAENVDTGEIIPIDVVRVDHLDSDKIPDGYSAGIPYIVLGPLDGMMAEDVTSPDDTQD